jgi:hypothetical protein
MGRLDNFELSKTSLPRVDKTLPLQLDNFFRNLTSNTPLPTTIFIRDFVRIHALVYTDKALVYTDEVLDFRIVDINYISNLRKRSEIQNM